MKNEADKKAKAILSAIRELCINNEKSVLMENKVIFSTDSFNAATIFFAGDGEHYHFGSRKGTVDEWIDDLYDIMVNREE